MVPYNRIILRGAKLLFDNGLCTCKGSRFGLVKTSRAFITTTAEMADEHNYSPSQIKQLNDECIVVDETDTIIGSATKKDCHILREGKIGLLHRAFSVFLFNSSGELLLQQRSNSKITFPEYFTNSCCSHPQFTDDEREDDENNRIGIKRAAKRRLNYELGIPLDQINLDELKFLTRVHYAAPADDKWGEHEIDYVLFLQKDVDLNVNPDEVKSICYGDKRGLEELMNRAHRKEIKVTPWFAFITEKLLHAWWDSLSDLEIFVQESVIHRGPIVPKP